LNVTIYLRDGTKQEFQHSGRSGGSYTKSLRYEVGYVIVADEWGNEVAFPNDLVLRVETRPTRGYC
jgi:hypothetical protein